jgi:ATP-dependent Zn protease
MAELIVMCGVLAAFLYASYAMMQNQEKTKKHDNFEFKKAKDVTQKLADVKGIDEIRDEIQDLIKMIKN